MPSKFKPIEFDDEELFDSDDEVQVQPKPSSPPAAKPAAAAVVTRAAAATSSSSTAAATAPARKKSKLGGISDDSDDDFTTPTPRPSTNLSKRSKASTYLEEFSDDDDVQVVSSKDKQRISSGTKSSPSSAASSSSAAKQQPKAAATASSSSKQAQQQYDSDEIQDYSSDSSDEIELILKGPQAAASSAPRRSSGGGSSSSSKPAVKKTAAVKTKASQASKSSVKDQRIDNYFQKKVKDTKYLSSDDEKDGDSSSSDYSSKSKRQRTSLTFDDEDDEIPKSKQTKSGGVSTRTQASGYVKDEDRGSAAAASASRKRRRASSSDEEEEISSSRVKKEKPKPKKKVKGKSGSDLRGYEDDLDGFIVAEDGDDDGDEIVDVDSDEDSDVEEKKPRKKKKEASPQPVKKKSRLESTPSSKSKKKTTSAFDDDDEEDDDNLDELFAGKKSKFKPLSSDEEDDREFLDNVEDEDEDLEDNFKLKKKTKPKQKSSPKEEYKKKKTKQTKMTDMMLKTNTKSGQLREASKAETKKQEERARQQLEALKKGDISVVDLDQQDDKPIDDIIDDFDVDDFPTGPSPAVTSSAAAASQNTQEEDDNSVPLDKRILNLGKTDSEKWVTMPSSLAKLLKPHQLHGIQYAWQHVVMPKEDNHRGCILAHSMGLGKTFQMIAFSYMFLKEKIGKRIVVVCPKNVLGNWPREFVAWCKRAGIVKPAIHTFNDDVTRADDRIALFKKWEQDGGILIISFTMVSRLLHPKHTGKKHTDPTLAAAAGSAPTVSGAKKDLQDLAYQLLSDPGPDLCIVDEGHLLKNEATQMSQSMNMIKTRRRLLLTGTPLQNHLMEYFTMVNFIRPGYWERKEFKNYFAEPIKAGLREDSTDYEVKCMKFRSYTLVNEMTQFVDRRDQSVLRTELPPKQEFIVYVKCNDFQRRLYRAFLKSNSGLDYKRNLFYYCCMLHKVINHPDLLRLYCLRNNINVPEDAMEALRSSGYELDDKFSRARPSPSKSSRTTAKLDDDQTTLDASIKSIKKQIQLLNDSDDDLEDDDGDIFMGDASSAAPAGTTVAPSADLSEEDHNRRAAVAEVLGFDLPIAVQKLADTEQDKRNKAKKLEKEKQKKARSKKTSSLLQVTEDGELEEDTDEMLHEIEEFAASQKTDFSWVLPVLLNNYKEGSPEYSNKMIVLIKMLEDFFYRGEKVLLFSQFTETLTVIENVLRFQPITVDAQGTKRTLRSNRDYQRLDGSSSVNERETMVKKFNTPSSQGGDDRLKLFLLSTRAGGLGINVTAATRVILFDCCFDPSHDTQSIFRAYRYGQTRPVHVYRLIGAGTVEEAIWKRCVAKNWLFNRCVDDKTPVRLLKEADLDIWAFDQSDEQKVSAQLNHSVFRADDTLPELLTPSSKDEEAPMAKLIHKVEEHDSLFIEDIKDKLTKEEQERSKKEYTAYKEGGPLAVAQLGRLQTMQGGSLVKREKNSIMAGSAFTDLDELEDPFEVPEGSLPRNDFGLNVKVRRPLTSSSGAASFSINTGSSASTAASYGLSFTPASQMMYQSSQPRIQMPQMQPQPRQFVQYSQHSYPSMSMEPMTPLSAPGTGGGLTSLSFMQASFGEPPAGSSQQPKRTTQLLRGPPAAAAAAPAASTPILVPSPQPQQVQPVQQAHHPTPLQIGQQLLQHRAQMYQAAPTPQAPVLIPHEQLQALASQHQIQLLLMEQARAQEAHWNQERQRYRAMGIPEITPEQRAMFETLRQQRNVELPADIYYYRTVAESLQQWMQLHAAQQQAQQPVSPQYPQAQTPVLPPGQAPVPLTSQGTQAQTPQARPQTEPIDIDD